MTVDECRSLFLAWQVGGMAGGQMIATGRAEIMRGLTRAALIVMLSAGAAMAQQAPAGPTGFAVKELATIDLGPELPGMEGRVLRMSHVTVAPGGMMPAHPHRDRPEIIYVVSGTLTENRNGQIIQYGPGGVLVMTKDITHALENKGATPAIYIAAPIARKP
jgi:quercetin dioxygenase-like cupin family protein